MAITNTTYLGLNKPDYDAIADIEVLNDNADIIDDMFDGTHLVEKVNGVSPVGGEAVIDLGVTSVNGMTGAVTITERSVKQLIDIIYPVGSYYETTNNSFNPNSAWAGTTWVKITDGRTLIAGGGDYTVGNTYGEKTHKITVAEMPQHDHNATTSEAANHHHDRGNMNITGTIYNAAGNNDLLFNAEPQFEGAIKLGNKRTKDKGGYVGTTETGYDSLTFNARDSWDGYTSANGAHKHTVTVGKTGSGTAMSMLQPSQAVARWLRTA